jgi:hypothetical protein
VYVYKRIYMLVPASWLMTRFSPLPPAESGGETRVPETAAEPELKDEIFNKMTKRTTIIMVSVPTYV